LKAFSFLPGITIEVTDDHGSKEEWEVFTDAFNEHYLYCKQTDSFAYFMNNGVMFMFTNFIGEKDSMLYTFYISCYKIFLSLEEGIETADHFPLHQFKKGPLRWMQDFLSPFAIFLQSNYTSIGHQSSEIGESEIQINATHFEQVLGSKKENSTSEITVNMDNQLSIIFTKKDYKTSFTCRVVA
jgi:hypothetical protein